MTETRTATDLVPVGWSIDDDVIRLREWRSGRIHSLPAPPNGDHIIGSAESCAVRLIDPSGRVSRRHARLSRVDAGWVLRDLGSTNGLRVDGVRRGSVVLEPGVEIGIGGLTLVADSPRLIALRGYLARVLGWAADRADAVDHAVRSIRVAATRRAALVLCGGDDLVAIAAALHHRALGADRPFVVADPRRRRTAASARAAENFRAATSALRAAAGGTLCVWRDRLPHDFAAALAALRDPGARIQLVVCARAPDRAEADLAAPIVVPPLAARAGELDRIIDEHARDAIDRLAARASSFQPSDRVWIREHAASSLSEIAKATLRLVAIREARSLNRAAALLGMTHVSLSRWLGRRRLFDPG